MITNLENIKTLQFWAELPIEVINGALKELFRSTVKINPVQEASIQYYEGGELEEPKSEELAS